MNEPTIRVSVTFRKQLSDGNFGSETAEAYVEDIIDNTEDQEAWALSLNAVAKRVVLAQLASSGNARIRQALAPPPGRPHPATATIPPEPDDDGDESPF